ncbi:MAG: radical SAM protein [Chloroflexi bacterium]|nr:radical SAM protein [Chloroflexota bacterium]MYG90157.1 radical SAM protein [Chloroflexota bacterium]MYJ92236.1 radical SAM protein [Chloroflexota bacterium]
MARVLLISTYEQGHQPLGVAAPAAALRSAGHGVSAFDLAVESVSPEQLQSAAAEADLIGISTPMHTAGRLGVRIARQLEGMSDKIVFYGLAAGLLRDLGLGRAISGDTDLQLVALANGEATSAIPVFDRESRVVPDRSILPALDRYASYRDASGGSHLAGYVEATRGCAHRCTHCPLTPIYAGRLRLNGAETVLADIDQQVAAGAEHITFGDPDFLNAPELAMDLLRSASMAHPGITFDATIKVEHLIEHQNLLPEVTSLGVTFITSAFESVDDRLLEVLDKGHTAADLDLALDLTAQAEIALRPTWLPFTPWTSAGHYLGLLEFVETRRLVDLTPPVQLGLRLLVPSDSPLVDPMGEMHSLTSYDADGLTWNWRHEDPRMDDLQAEIAALAERQAPFAEIKHAACRALGVEPWPDVDAPHVHRPGLTEDWFC